MSFFIAVVTRCRSNVRCLLSVTPRKDQRAEVVFVLAMASIQCYAASWHWVNSVLLSIPPRLGLEAARYSKRSASLGLTLCGAAALGLVSTPPFLLFVL